MKMIIAMNMMKMGNVWGVKKNVFFIEMYGIDVMMKHMGI
jgi:hypothetical protein